MNNIKTVRGLPVEWDSDSNWIDGHVSRFRISGNGFEIFGHLQMPGFGLPAGKTFCRIKLDCRNFYNCHDIGHETLRKDLVAAVDQARKLIALEN